MRIVNLQEFLSLPPETLFQKYHPSEFGALCVKGETLTPNDFLLQPLEGAIKCGSTEEYCSLLDAAVEAQKSLEVEFSWSRDGSFDNAQLFAVWEEKDIALLVDRLKECMPL